MRKKGMLKRWLALGLAAAMTFTGSGVSGAYVYAAQEESAENASEEETTEAAEQAAEEGEQENPASEIISETETISDAETSEKEMSEENMSETETSEALTASDAEETTETETTEAETTAEETTEAEETEETDAQDEDLTTKYGAPLLKLGTNDGYVFYESDGREKRYFAFTADESGVYSVDLTMLYPADFTLELINYDNEVDSNSECDDDQTFVTNEIIFPQNAGETAYFYVRVWNGTWTSVEIEPATELDAVFTVSRIDQSGETTVTQNSDTSYTLSCGDISLSLDFDISYTGIEISKSTTGKRAYVFCNGLEDIDYEYNLGVGTECHFTYVVQDDDGNYYFFDGTGMPFDVSTKDTDKEGIISDISADATSFTVKCEIFNPSYGWLRYRKAEDDAEWIYDYVEKSLGTTYSFSADSETTYDVELVSYDKQTVYDSAEVTTTVAGEDGIVNISIDEDALTADTATITLSDYEYDGTYTYLYVYVDYTNSYGVNYANSYKSISYRAFTDGVYSFSIDNLKAGTAYDDVTVKVKGSTKTAAKVLASATLSFTTKEASFDEDALTFTFEENGTNAVTMTAEIADLSEDSVSGTYRYRIAGDDDYGSVTSFTISKDTQTSVSLTGLSAGTEYELEYNIGGITGSKTFQTAELSYAVPVIEVENAYFNGLELACSLTGEIDDSTYRGYIYVYNSKWRDMGSVTFDGTETVTKKVASYYVIPGQTQQWKCEVYRGSSLYYKQFFEAESKSDLTLTDLSASGTLHKQTLKCTAEDAVITGYANIKSQYKVSDDEEWSDCDSNYLYFDSEGNGKITLYFYKWDGENILVPGKEYEFRLINGYDESIVYGTTGCTVEADWQFDMDDMENVTFIYDTAGTPYITIEGNVGAPTAEAADESVVSVRKIMDSETKAKIYLNLNGIGSTTLYVTADGLTQEIGVTVSVASELYYLEGADESLDSIPLPSKYSWAEPDTVPVADSENEIQYFEVTYTEDGETKSGTVPVYVSRLDNITIAGDDTIGAGKEKVYSVYYSGTGYSVTDGGAYRITQEWSSSDDENLIISSRSDDTNVNVFGGNNSEGTYTLLLDVTIENIRSGNCWQVTAEQEVRVIAQGLIDSIIIKPAEVQPTDAVPYTVSGAVASGSVAVSCSVIVIDGDDYDADTKSKVQLAAWTASGSAIQAADLIWESQSDSLDVDDTGLVTILNLDSAQPQLKVSSNDGGNYSVPVVFKIFSYVPVFASKSLTVTTGSAKGAKLEYTAQNGNSVTGMAIKDNTSQLELSEADDGWYIKAKDGNTYKGITTEDITLTVSTLRGDYEQAISVKVDATAPTELSAVFTQTETPNLFFVNSQAVFSVSSGYEIEDITTKDNTAVNFHVSEYDADAKELKLAAYDLKNNLNDYTAKNSSNATADILVKFKGYDNAVEYNLTVAVQNKALTLKAEDACVLSASGSALVAALSGKEEYDISGAEVKSVSASKNDVTASVEDGKLKLGYTGSKSTSYKLTLENDNWAKDVTVSGNISKTDFSKLSLKASKTKATINTKYPESITVSFAIKGNSGLEFTTKYQVAKSDAPITVAEDGNSLVISANTGAKKGNYKISVWGQSADGSAETKKTTLTVAVTDKEPTVKLSAKGSLNVLNSESGITYTAVIKNMDATVAEVTNLNNDNFEITNDGNKLFLKASDGASIKAGTKYTAGFDLELSNNHTLHVNEVKIKPVSKLPKIKAVTTNASMASDDSADIGLTYEDGYTISSVELVSSKDSAYFDISIDEHNTVTIGLKDATSKPSKKSCTLKYKVYLEGTDKAVSLKLKVTF